MYSGKVQRWQPSGPSPSSFDIIQPSQPARKSGPVVLVSREIEFTFPLAYGYLTGYLKHMGEDVRMLYKTKDFSELVKQIMELNPVIVGFGSLYPELKETGEIINLLNQAGRTFPIVIGGQMVTPTPEFAVEITGADYGVIGEGEITLHKLVNAVRDGSDPSHIRGLVIRQGNSIFNTGPGEFIEDLNTLPPIPYELFPTEKWLPIGKWYAENCPQPHWKVEDRVINVHGGRGCPFTCNFCYHHSKPRYRRIEVMMDEAQAALKRFDGNMLYFSDDLVLATPKRARELVDAIRLLDRRVEWSVTARFDTLARIDDSLLGEMRDAGLRIMGLGVESGSDRILQIIGKNCTAAVMREQMSRLHKLGIMPTVSIMLAQYTETRQDVEASIDFVRDTVRENPNVNYAFTVTTPFPGSQLYNLIMSNGVLRDHRHFYDIYFSTSGNDFKQIVNLSEMGPQELTELYGKLHSVYQEEKARGMGAEMAA